MTSEFFFTSLAILAFVVAVLVYCCCASAGRSDRRAERMQRDLRHKLATEQWDSIICDRRDKAEAAPINIKPRRLPGDINYPATLNPPSDTVNLVARFRNDGK